MQKPLITATAVGPFALRFFQGILVTELTELGLMVHPLTTCPKPLPIKPSFLD